MKITNWIVCLFLLLTAAETYVKAQVSLTGWKEGIQWISPSFTEDSPMRACPVFRKPIVIDKPLRSATLLITARGLYEAYVNTKRVGTALFTPGWTEYDKRLQYQQYAVSQLLKKGQNTIEVTVGEGWYRGVFGGLMLRNNYGNEAALLVQLELVFKDGTRRLVTTDSSWQVTTGPVLYSDIYAGERYDARIQPINWRPVKIAAYPMDNLVAGKSEPVEKQEAFAPVKVWRTPQGDQVIDFGQNLAGWVQCTVEGKAGDTLQLQHAEMLDKDGNFYTGNLREARATDTYILSGKGKETFEPHFTWHGFRYVKVTGVNVNPDNWKAIAIYSSLPEAGSFSCSDTLLNRLQQNIIWSLKGNFLDIPTDCPQRSERLGWTGDAHVFFRTAGFNRNVKLFFAKWLQDVKAAQRPDGSVPNIVPNIYKNLAAASKVGRAGWGDAAVLIPWMHYEVYGDTAILRDQYTSMKAWVDYIGSVSKDDLWTANGYGDWLAPGDSTSLPLIDQCFWAWSTQLLVNAAVVLEKTEEAAYYNSLLTRIKTAFLQHYIQPDGRAVTHTQTAYVLSLQCDMLPDTLQQKAAQHLAALVKANNSHLSTGFLGTPYLLFMLSKYGYTSLAYEVLLQDTYPSWLYPVKMGATTIWEKWNAVKPDGTVQATSYNHYAYGAVGDWLYRQVAGIEAGAPGYRHIIIQPHAGGGLTWVKAHYQCRYGKIVSNWKIENGRLLMEVEIPTGTTATVYVPGKAAVAVTAGHYTFEGVPAIP